MKTENLEKPPWKPPIQFALPLPVRWIHAAKDKAVDTCMNASIEQGGKA